MSDPDGLSEQEVLTLILRSARRVSIVGTVYCFHAQASAEVVFREREYHWTIFDAGVPPTIEPVTNTGDPTKTPNT